MQPRLTSNSPFSQGWPWTSSIEPTASVSYMVGWQACTIDLASVSLKWVYFHDLNIICLTEDLMYPSWLWIPYIYLRMSFTPDLSTPTIWVLGCLGTPPCPACTLLGIKPRARAFKARTLSLSYLLALLDTSVTGSHSVTLAYLQLTMQPRLASNPPESFCLHILNVGITGVYYHSEVLIANI